MPALLALSASLMWGAADFLGGSLSRRMPALAVYGLSQVVGLAALLVFATATGAWDADPAFWPWAIGAGVLGIVSMVTFYAALAIGPMGIISPLVALSVLIPVGYGLLRGEQPASIAMVGILVAVVGVLLASGPELSGGQSPRALVLAGTSALAFGVIVIFMAEGSQYSATMTVTGMRITALTCLLCVAIWARSIGNPGSRDILPLVAIGIMDAAANVAFGMATALGMLATVSVLAALYPVVTAVLAAIVLRERLKPVQYIGVTGAILGVVMISAGA